MPLLSSPSLPLPASLAAAEVPSFTHFSVCIRLPDIARRTLDENEFSPETAAGIQALIDEIPHGAIRSLDTPLAPDQHEWDVWVQAYLNKNWLDVPWFFAEEYFYRRILEATGYFKPGRWQGVDPYRQQKRLGLETARGDMRKLAEQVSAVLVSPGGITPNALERLLLVDLWGNQNDLSMWPVSPVSGGGSIRRSSTTSEDKLQSAQSHVLVNDLPAVVEYLTQLDPVSARVDILLDNAGHELITDLALADFLITGRMIGHVTLHAKTYPVFVSDALERDIHSTLDTLAFDENPEVKSMGVRLRSYLIDRRLSLHQHPFWTSPQPMWELPDGLVNELSGSDLLIVKGDANYRRLLGDRHWAVDLPFARVVDYLPCSTVALRTLKSEIAVGIPNDHRPLNDPQWMTNGKWGLIQFARA